MTSPMKVFLLAGAVACASLVQAEIIPIEQSVETTAASVVLPSSPPSSVVITQCVGCRPLTISTTARAQYFLNREPVELGELKRQLAGRPNAFLIVTYDAKTGELLRLFARLDLE